MDLATLPDLIRLRASGLSPSQMHILENDSNESVSVLYTALYAASTDYARRLLGFGLERGRIVLSCFSDHESHIRPFWACCLAGVMFCPLPTLHSDETRQTLLFQHLQRLFINPIIVGSRDTVNHIRRLMPGLQCTTPEDLATVPASSCDKVFPSIRPSPDDIVCLMLTSGSTGNSKAVALRHSNILSSIRGKVAAHGTGASSRFLNWIAFDHVACVTEIHLHAMYCGASQWHVPTAAIINNPLLLLKLVHDLRVTYTFSPNFLVAQILRLEATCDPLDLSTLEAFISGGEAVPLVTAIAFADLLENHGAPRNSLRAGFGMSETGAGCIYDTQSIPRSLDSCASRHPKYLPVGKCCSGIEMRIVDTDSFLDAPPGEPGALQLRGPTVFSEYYGNSAATEAAFDEQGWFTTGDLAVADSTGIVRLIGREKDCLIINGVKYVPQEIAQFIQDQEIEGLQTVLVCPLRLENADTETYAVFYQHALAPEPESALTLEEERTLVSVRSRVSRAATVFCTTVPHVVLPLPHAAFVRTALGKVSAAQLLRTYLNGEYDFIVSLLADLSKRSCVEDRLDLDQPIQRVVSEVLSEIFSFPISELRLSQSMFDLGSSSIHLIRVKQALQERLSVRDIPTIDLLTRPVLSDLCSYLATRVSSETKGPSSQPYQPLICLNSSGDKPPLFLIHPGVGEVLVFVNLARSFIGDRPVYALRARGFDYDHEPFQSFSEMVTCYTSAIQKCDPSGSYRIAGYSLGGAIAFEVGKLLENQGHKVEFLGILNLPPHIQFRILQLNWVEVLLNLIIFLSLSPERSMDGLRRKLGLAFPKVSARVDIPNDITHIVQYLLQDADTERLQELDLDPVAFARWVKVAHAVNGTARRYEPSGQLRNGLMSVFCAIPLSSIGSKQEFKDQRLARWREFCDGTFEMVDVDVNIIRC